MIEKRVHFQDEKQALDVVNHYRSAGEIGDQLMDSWLDLLADAETQIGDATDDQHVVSAWDRGIRHLVDEMDLDPDMIFEIFYLTCVYWVHGEVVDKYLTPIEKTLMKYIIMNKVQAIAETAEQD